MESLTPEETQRVDNSGMLITYPQRVRINDLTKGATSYTLGNTTGNVVSDDPIDELPDNIPN